LVGVWPASTSSQTRETISGVAQPVSVLAPGANQVGDQVVAGLGPAARHRGLGVGHDRGDRLGERAAAARGDGGAIDVPARPIRLDDADDLREPPGVLMTSV
jgi:hypothetical protein